MNLIDVKSIACPSCGAAVRQGEPRCQFCGTPIEWEQPQTQAEAAPVVTGAEQIVDYYAMIGLYFTPEEGPPSKLEIQQHVLQAQQSLLLDKYLDPQQRQQMVEELEVGGWILTDDRARGEYDGLLFSMRTGNFTPQHVATLTNLQHRARAELGLNAHDTSSEDLLRQAVGYYTLGMYGEAIPVLKQVLQELPDSAEAHYYYGLSIVNDGNPFSKSSHELRQAMRSLETASTLDPALTDAPAYAALSRGLLERENGNFAAAEAALREAVTQNSELSAAWRGLAALALRAHKHGEVMDHCRRALMQNPRDEHAYLLLTASCWRAGQRQFAHDAASRIASLRGAGWTPERVLQEVVG